MEIIKHGVVGRATEGFFRYQGWPTVCRDEAGTLYAVCSGMRLAHVCPCGKDVLYISRDGGETWTPPMVVNDTCLDDRDAGILSLGGGKLLMTWFAHDNTSPYYSLDNAWKQSVTQPAQREIVEGMLRAYTKLTPEEGQGGSWTRFSADGGVTWSENRRAPVTSPHGPVLLRDGRLLWIGNAWYSEVGEFGIFACESRDQGTSWQVISHVPCPDGLQETMLHEPNLLELPSGRLLGAIRVDGAPTAPSFTFCLTHSDDGGVSWSKPLPTGISGSPPFLMRHSSGAVLLFYARRETPFGVRVLISQDQGQTWSEELEVGPHGVDADLGYPSAVELDDGSILTVYYQKYAPGEPCSILSTRWRL